MVIVAYQHTYVKAQMQLSLSREEADRKAEADEVQLMWPSGWTLHLMYFTLRELIGVQPLLLALHFFLHLW